jgi:hypothetical protein
MPVFAVDLAFVRDVLLPDLRLTVGRAVMARVVSPGGAGGAGGANESRGTLSIAGYLLGAELPRGVKAGQELRLEVRDIDDRRVLLGIADHPEPEPDAAAPSPAAHAATAPIPLPGGATLRIVEHPGEDEDGGGRRGSGEGSSRTLALRLDGVALGAVDLRFELDPATLRVGVALSPGAALEAATREADALRGALAAGADRAVSVTVSARRDPLDVYA